MGLSTVGHHWPDVYLIQGPSWHLIETNHHIPDNTRSAALGTLIGLGVLVPLGILINMPKDASLTDAERIRLGKWLTCGAP